MHRPSLYVLSASLLALWAAAPSAAWGPIGHRAVGRIAERYLTPAAAHAVSEILAPERLAYVGTWADEIRTDPAWNKAIDWHWIDAPEGVAIGEGKRNPNGDILEAIERFRGILADPTQPRLERAQALKFLVHFLGDLHQPLHAGTTGDRGGNEILVTWFDKPSNLHAVWDEGMIEQAKLSAIELAEKVDHPTLQEVAAWQAQGPLEWARESHALLPEVYKIGDRRLGWKYQSEHWPTVEQQIAKAGVRLAALLNRCFAPTGPRP